MRVLRVYPAGNNPRHRLRDRALAAAGVEVGLALPHRYGGDWAVTEVEPEIRPYRVGMLNRGSIPFHLWSPAGLLRAIRRFRPDVIDVHEEWYFPPAAEAVALAGRRPTVAYAAQNLDKHLPLPIRAVARGHTLRRVRALYACSAGAAAVARRHGYGGPVPVIPLGADDELFTTAATAGSRIGFVGRLVPEKGVRDLLHHGTRLLCVGGGPLAGEVAAAGGEVRLAATASDLLTALREMAVLAVPSRATPRWQEQFGRQVVEAMAAGTPVVAYASGSLPEVVGDAGLLVPEGDVAALDAALLRAEHERDAWAQRGQARASRLYRWSSIAAAMVAMYERATA